MPPPSPANPDGTPNLDVIAGTGSVAGGGTTDNSGMLSIWDLPTDLPAGLKIWFDVGHTTRPVTPLTGSATKPELIGAVPVPSTAPTGAASQERTTSHQILRSPSQIMKQFAAMSFNNPGEFLALQKALALGPWGTVNPSGSFDAATEKALGQAMLQYVKVSHGAGVGVSFVDYLLQSSQRNAELNQQQTAPTNTAIGVTDPTEIRAAAQSAAMQALGQGLTGDQLDKFVAQFQAAQVSAAKATSGQVSSPDLSSQAQAYAQQTDPKAYKQNQRQAFLSALVNMFAPPGSQRPTMTPTPSVGG